MKQRASITGANFVANVAEVLSRFEFSYQGQKASHRVVAIGTAEAVVVVLSSLEFFSDAEREQVFDAFWQLAQQVGVGRVDLAARAGDPYETYPVRPR